MFAKNSVLFIGLNTIIVTFSKTFKKNKTKKVMGPFIFVNAQKRALKFF